MVLKIWDLGLGFGIHLQKIRDLGFWDPRLPTPDFDAFFESTLTKSQADQIIKEYGENLKNKFQESDTVEINRRIDSALDLVQNCLKEDDVEIYKDAVAKYERKIGHVVGWEDIRNETLEIKSRMDNLEKEFTEIQTTFCKFFSNSDKIAIFFRKHPI